MGKEPKKYKTIVMSDVHLGSKWSKTKQATLFLRRNSCETLILCGDIIDGWSIMRGSSMKWKRRHTNFIQAVLDMSVDTKIIYLRGNHDDFLDRLLPMSLHNISVVKDYIFTSNGQKYYVLHGDIFDYVTSSMSWLAKLGDVGYSMLLWFNNIYNLYRAKRGLPYNSISQKIKNKVKASVSYIGDFEKHIVDVAKSRDCRNVICGHIHHPDIKQYGDVRYLNSGDWVESLSALTEDFDGNWAIYQEEHSSKTENSDDNE
ncbi:MAG: UDP-2,3-diacylglucosamine diphosphatase [Rikenellaceae bacterium]